MGWTIETPDGRRWKVENPGDVPELRQDTGPRSPGVSFEPKKGPMPSGPTLRSMGVVNDLETKVRIAAKARFPDLPEEQAVSRYGVKDGRIYYVDQDNQARWETSGLQRVAEWGGELAASAPADIGAAAGLAFGGPLGMVAGAALGEGARMAEGWLRFDEPISIGGAAARMAVVGGAAAGGQWAGKKILGAGERAVQRLTSPASGRVQSGARKAARQAGDLTPLDPVEEQRVRALMGRYGITDPTLPETTGSKRLIDRFSLMGDLPATAEAVQGIKTGRMAQVDEAVEQWLRSISPIDDPLIAGQRAAAASRSAVEGAREGVQAASRDLYTRAFAEAPAVNTRPAVDRIDVLLQGLPATSQAAKRLQRVRRMLVLEEGAPARAGQAARPAVLESDLQRLQVVKEEIDAILSGTDLDWSRLPGATQARLRRNMTEAQKTLLQATDAASPTYRQARAAHEAAIPGLAQVQGSAVGTVADLKGDKVTQATTRLLESAFTSPETVRRASALIRASDPEAWDAVVRQWLGRQWDLIPTAARAGDTVDYGGRLAGKLTAKGRDRILEAALGHNPAQLANTKDFLFVLSRTGALFKRESATATRQVAIQEMEQELGKTGVGLAAGALDFARSPVRTTVGYIRNTLARPEYQRKVLEALQDPAVAQELARMKRLPPKSRQLAAAVGAFVGAHTGGEVPETVERTFAPKEWAPALPPEAWRRPAGP